jgi:hypothetical protein
VQEHAFGRDAANVGNSVEASGQRPEVRSQDTAIVRESEHCTPLIFYGISFLR